ncbi:hypothetical protein [Rhizobium ruizarguesonis]|uniref:hypothetical protein n=1 Tax=Rhizobium ruizarguesonis TaxID=2081791 RepID=UPI001581BF1E|nr:hypothetical protein [Rhizobium ruizarguesonis]
MSISGMALARLGQVYPMRPIIPPMNMIRRRKGRIGECAARDDDSAGKVCSGFRESAPSKNNAMVMRFYRRLLSTSHQPLDDANERCARRASPTIGMSACLRPSFDAADGARESRSGPSAVAGNFLIVQRRQSHWVNWGSNGEDECCEFPVGIDIKTACRPFADRWERIAPQSETPPVIESDSSDR